MKKQIAALLLISLVLTAMAGCGTETPQDAPNTNAPQQTQGTTESGVDVEEDGTQTTTAQSETDGVSAAFKETMDAYEAYFDEYIAFMEKYKANPSDLSLLADYAEFMSSYASMMEKMSALGDQEMTTAEAAYYLEVTTRINQKLLKVAE